MGRVVSPEHRAKLAVAARNPSDETRAKMSAAAKARTHSAETRAEISSALKGRKRSPGAIAKVVTEQQFFGFWGV